MTEKQGNIREIATYQWFAITGGYGPPCPQLQMLLKTARASRQENINNLLGIAKFISNRRPGPRLSFGVTRYPIV